MATERRGCGLARSLLKAIRGVRLAITRGGRLCRTRHEPRVHGRVESDRKTGPKQAGSAPITFTPLDAGKTMGERIAGEPKALSRRAALHRWIFARWILPARTGENPPGEETLDERTVRALARADLFLQHGLLRCASWQFEVGAGSSPDQFQDGSFISRYRKEGPGPGVSSRAHLSPSRAAVGGMTPMSSSLDVDGAKPVPPCCFDAIKCRRAAWASRATV